MPASRPALRLIAGAATPSLSMVVGIATRAEAYWAAAWLDGLDVLLTTPLGDTDELLAASERLRVMEAKWDAARLRLERALCLAEGRPWLRVVGGER